MVLIRHESFKLLLASMTTVLSGVNTIPGHKFVTQGVTFEFERVAKFLLTYATFKTIRNKVT